MTLGYLCEDIEPCYIEESQMNDILYACLSNVSKDNIKISQIAVRAFARAAPYTNKNFQVDSQREYIMNVILNGLTIDDDEI